MMSPPGSNECGRRPSVIGVAPDSDSDPSTQVEAIDHLGPVESCPGCGARDFLITEQGAAVVFWCLTCVTGWRCELGFVWQIDADPPVSQAYD